MPRTIAIRIKKSDGVLAPLNLRTGELAYTYGAGLQTNEGDRLFFGSGDDGLGNSTSIDIIGGKYFTELLNQVHGTVTPNTALIVDSDGKLDELKTGNIIIAGDSDKITGIQTLSVGSILLSADSNTITGLITSEDSSSIATKHYVDSAVSGFTDGIDADSGRFGNFSTRDSGYVHISGRDIYIAPDGDLGGVIKLGNNVVDPILQHKLDLSEIRVKGDINPDTHGQTNNIGGYQFNWASGHFKHGISILGGQSEGNLAWKQPAIDIAMGAKSALQIRAGGIDSADDKYSLMEFDTLDSNPNNGDGRIRVMSNVYHDKNAWSYWGDSQDINEQGIVAWSDTDNDFIITSSGTSTQISGNTLKLIGKGNFVDSAKLVLVEGHFKPAAYNGLLWDVGSWGRPFGNAYFRGNVRARLDAADSEDLVNKRYLDSALGKILIDSATWDSSVNTLDLTLGDSTTSIVIDRFGSDITVVDDARLYLGDDSASIYSTTGDASLNLFGDNIKLITDPAAAGGGNIFASGDLIPRKDPVYSASSNWNIGEDSTYTWNNAYFMGTVNAAHFERLVVVVDSGVYGNRTQIPVITINSAGLIDSASVIDVASTLDIAGDVGVGDVELLDSVLAVHGGFNLNTIVDGRNITVHLDSDVLGLTSLTVDNIKIDGNTISSMDSSSQLYIDPAPVDSDGGDVIIRGNLIVQGTETIVNSSVLSVNDKNIVLADSAADNATADGAGITVGGSSYVGVKPEITFDAATNRWDLNLPIDVPYNSLDSAMFLNGVAMREVIEDHLNNFFAVDSNGALTLTYDDIQNSMTWKAINATKDQVGVSSFDSASFLVTNGHVTVAEIEGGSW